jgi:xanthine dehydrogenase molybdopterin-binding subunit B
MIKIKH